ncbi:MAG: 5-methylcytosine-specific restriction endonuclease system specificity protein McrC [Solobacterium sp.]|nr:5-methylcytosine-specific restriction endonuclease system specificity protein McrC [Solobacterium sp.]
MIPVRNIYYMLSYAFQALQNQGIREADVESFDNASELYAEILLKAVSIQIKRGLRRDYIPKTELMSSVKGKIEVADSLKSQSIQRGKLICTYDDYSVDNILNRIIKTTFLHLLRTDIKMQQKKEIRKILIYFDDVSETDLLNMDWNFRYERNNQTYQLLVAICRFLAEDMLQTQTGGNKKTADYKDEQRMSRLYEKFILEYYRKHYKQLSPSAPEIEWQIESGKDSMLPSMKSDIVLSKGNRILIIDAKYYSRNTQVQFDKHTIHSNNLYQIFTYVKNMECKLQSIEGHEVAGMLLYARTDDEIQPDSDYVLSGNRISIKNLDLNQDFSGIAGCLDGIVKDYFTV